MKKSRTPHLVLWGFMASGKSTVGLRLAKSLRRPFVDLDAVIEGATGSTIAELFAREGEAAFRTLETRALRRALAAKSPAVIALGGGALLALGNFRLAARHELWLLHAPLAEIIKRLARGGAAGRPLAGGLAARWRERRRHYGKVPRKISTAGRAPETAALTLLLAREREPKNEIVLRGLHPARVAAGATGPTLCGFIAGFTRPPVLITHRRLADLLPAELRDGLRIIIIEEGERSKSAGKLFAIWNTLAALGADRATPVIGLGGGVIGDLAGFAAATYRRGAPFHFIPTTLTAMVDAGLGGKTAIDLDAGKNLAGLFAPPSSVLIDPAWLLTLPPRELANGLAELIKTAALKSPAALAAVERDLPRLLDGDTAALTRQIAMAAEYKLALCARDPRETGPRLWLNLGHTIAHQIEKELHYDRLTHGEAVAIGLCEELRLAARLRVIPPKEGAALANRLAKILTAAGLPVSLREAGLRGDAARWMNRALSSDKKTIDGSLRWPLLRAPGKPFVARYPVKSAEKN